MLGSSAIYQPKPDGSDQCGLVWGVSQNLGSNHTGFAPVWFSVGYTGQFGLVPRSMVGTLAFLPFLFLQCLFGSSSMSWLFGELEKQMNNACLGKKLKNFFGILQEQFNLFSLTDGQTSELHFDLTFNPDCFWIWTIFYNWQPLDVSPIHSFGRQLWAGGFLCRQ